MFHSTLAIVVRISTITNLLFSSILPLATVSASPLGDYEREGQGGPSLRQSQAVDAAEQAGVYPDSPPAGQDVPAETVAEPVQFSIEADPVSRMTNGLQVLYTFEEGSGTAINDASGVGTPLDLTIAGESATSWGSNYLSIDSATIASSGVAATKVISASQASNEITIEAWVRPANATQSGPARIVSLSADPGNRNFTLGQRMDYYQIRLRTTTTGNNGMNPSVSTPAGSLTAGLTHVVYTRDATGLARVYLDNVEVVSQTIAGDLSNWDESYRLGLANELTSDRPWLGELHLVAVYSRALGQAEVEQNFAAGPGGPQVPLADFFADPPIGPVPLTVTFTNSSTDATDYLWAFGDGSTSIEENPVYTYTTAGVYTVTLTANGVGGSDTLTRTNYITLTEPVGADFSANPLTGIVPLTVTFTNNSTNASDYL